MFPRNLNNGTGWGLLFSIILLSEFNRYDFFIGIQNPLHLSRSAREIIILCQECCAYVQVYCIEYELKTV